MKVSKSVLAVLLALVLVLSPLAGTITVNAAGVYELTGLTNHSAGWTSGGIYISHNAHGATYNSDWSVEYKPLSEGVIKLIRNGETFNVGVPSSATLVVYSATEMYFKTEAWTVSGDKLPFVDGDKIIIEGQFKHDGSSDILNVERTEIVVRGSGVGINAIEASALSNHTGAPGGNGVYATMTADGAPYKADWSLEYTPVSADAYRVIRDGVELNIGQPGRGTLVRINETDHYLKFSGWCVGDFTAQTSDIFIIEGFWKQNGGSTTIAIPKTYLYHDGNTWVFAKQLPATIDAGVMQTHESGMSGNGIYFKTAANGAPSNTDCSIEYKQTSADNIKIIRGGVTTSIGIVDRPLFVKLNECDYYLKLENWTIGEYGLDSTSPITTDDILIIEGRFEYENVTLNITKSFVYYNGSAWACSESESNLEKIYNVGHLSAHAGGSNTGFHATGAENDAPYDWKAEYAPTSADCIQIIRNGVTYATANTGAGTVVKFDTNGYFVKFDSWMNSNYPLQAGDLIIVEGVFVGTGNYAAAEGVKIRIDKTYISYDGSSFRFAEKYINAGAMQTHEGGMSGSGIYFRTAANDAPSNNDWTLEYKQTSTDNIKLVRNGKTISIGINDRPLLLKLNECDYYLKLENWTIGDYAPITTEDMLIIEGEFVYAAEKVTLKISKSYVYYDGSAWVCSTECPHPSQATVVEGAVAPTCTETGLTEGKHCSVCGTVLVAQETVSALGHKPGQAVKENTVEPDCTNAGSYDSVVYCTVCKKELSRNKVIIAANGHTEVVDAAVAPTCTATGLTEGKHCSVCNTVLVAQNVVPANGHSYEAEFATVNNVPTVTYTCSCGDKQVAELKFQNASLTLQNNIVVNFKTVAGVAGTEECPGFKNLRAEFTYGYRENVSADAVSQDDGRYNLACSGVSPSQVGDEITATLYGTYNGEVYSFTMTYSAAQYCYAMLENKNSSEELKTLLVNLLYYCDAAREYTTYQGVDEEYQYYGSVTEDLTDAQKAYRTVSNEFQSVMYQDGEGTFTATWKSASLVISDATAIQFTVDMGGSDLTADMIQVKVGGSAYSNVRFKNNGGDTWLILVEGLSAHRMSDTVAVTLSSDGQVISKTVSYSIESYAARNMNNSNAKLVDMLVAMMNYGDAAVAYKD